MEGHPGRRHHRKERCGGAKAKGSHHRMGLETDVGNERGPWEGGQHGVCLGRRAEFRIFFAAQTGFPGKLLSSKGLEMVMVFWIKVRVCGVKRQSQGTRTPCCHGRGPQASVWTRITRGTCDRCKSLLLTTPWIRIL